MLLWFRSRVALIGIRELSDDRLALYASHCPLDVLKTALYEHLGNAYVVIVLYEDVHETFHETGIYTFDASEPETYNYKNFTAPLVDTIHNRLAVCRLTDLFVHFERVMLGNGHLKDDPFHNLLISLMVEPPNRSELFEWVKHMHKRLRVSLYDRQSREHFLLFPQEACVIYSHANYFTSITSTSPTLLEALFSKICKHQLDSVCRSSQLPCDLIEKLFWHTQEQQTIQFHTDRLYNLENQSDKTLAHILVSYPKQKSSWLTRVSFLSISPAGELVGLVPSISIPWWRFMMVYTDMRWLSTGLLLIFMILSVLVAIIFQFILVSPQHFS